MKRKSKKKIIIVISSVIMILIVILIIMNSIVKKQKYKEEITEKVNSYTSIEDFKTVEEVAIYLGCEYKKQERAKDENYKIDVYMKIKIMPYTDEQSNEGFYSKLIAYSASALKYQSFRIIDKEKDITIEVICDDESNKIKAYYINGEVDYFMKQDSYSQLNNMKNVKETNLNIQSNILKKLIDNNWRSNESDFGTKESVFNNYDIYFDEGIKVRKVNNKVFNIVFTDKYKEKIASDINTNMTKDEIVKQLGEPTFKDERLDFIGYKGKDIYLFYNSKKEISIYRAEKNYNSSEFAKLVDTYLENKDESELIQKVKDEYTDYDKFESDSSGTIIQYSLKGVVIRFQKGLSKGIQIYNNYTGKIYDDVKIENINENIELPDNIFVNNEDLVSKNEFDRIQNIENLIFSSMDEKSKNPEISQSEKYCTVKKSLDDGSYKIQFLAIDNNNIDSELRENINYYVWIDDDNFIYSIENRGIYLYNATLRKYATLVTGNDEKFEIKEYKNNTLKYDEKVLKIKK